MQPKGVAQTMLKRRVLPIRQAPREHSILGPDLFTYWEGMPAARLQFPAAIKFMIGSFPSLFGSRLGEKLRQWCARRGWCDAR